MTYSNSPLVTYTRISPNRNSPRNHAIDTVTVHCFVGQVTAKSGCDLQRFVNYDGRNGASCNYVVGYDGSIGLCVEEKDRSWCSGSASNDHRAVTIETASEKTPPYAVTEEALSALTALLADICRRNGKTKLLWFGDKAKTLSYQPKADEMVMTVHRWFEAKECPGEYLYGRHGFIAEEVNQLLGAAAPAPAAYQVRLLEDLNVRKTPGGEIVWENGAKKGFIYTILETQGEWGRLKSGAGWICVAPQYVERV